MTAVAQAPTTRRPGAATVLLGLLTAALLGVPAAVGTLHAAGTLQADPDPVAVGALIYPGTPVAVQPDPFAEEEPPWLRFLMARDDPAAPQVGPRDRLPGTAAPLIAAARSRVEAAGWHTHDGTPDSLAFWATRGDVRIDFYAFDMDPVGLDTFAQVQKLPAWWVTGLAVIGGLLGAALGWLLARWGSRRVREHTPASRTVIRETVLVGLVLAAPALVQSVLRLATGSSGTGSLPMPSWAELAIGYARWPAAVGVLLLAAAVVALLAIPPANAVDDAN